jgi:hypothetical protein
MAQSKLKLFQRAKSARPGLMQTDDGQGRRRRGRECSGSMRFRLKWKLALAGILLPQISKLSTREACPELSFKVCFARHGFTRYPYPRCDHDRPICWYFQQLTVYEQLHVFALKLGGSKHLQLSSSSNRQNAFTRRRRTHPHTGRYERERVVRTRVLQLRVGQC